MQFEVNNAINSKVPPCQGDITKINVDVIVNAANETWLGGEVIDRAIYEAAGPGLLDKCQKVNGCEIGECKVTAGNKWPANYVFHAVGPKYKNENKLKDCYESV